MDTTTFKLLGITLFTLTWLESFISILLVLILFSCVKFAFFRSSKKRENEKWIVILYEHFLWSVAVGVVSVYFKNSYPTQEFWILGGAIFSVLFREQVIEFIKKESTQVIPFIKKILTGWLNNKK